MSILVILASRTRRPRIIGSEYGRRAAGRYGSRAGASGSDWPLAHPDVRRDGSVRPARRRPLRGLKTEH